MNKRGGLELAKIRDWILYGLLLLVLALQGALFAKPMRLASDQVVQLVAQERAQAMLLALENQNLRRQMADLQKQIDDLKKKGGH